MSSIGLIDYKDKIYKHMHFNNQSLYQFAQVSWIRQRDHHLLTVGSSLYSSDERFSVTHKKDTNVSSYRDKR